MVLTPLAFRRHSKKSLTRLPASRYIGFGSTTQATRLTISVSVLAQSLSRFQQLASGAQCAAIIKARMLSPLCL
jgi:hypothetical protein